MDSSEHIQTNSNSGASGITQEATNYSLQLGTVPNSKNGAVTQNAIPAVGNSSQSLTTNSYSSYSYATSNQPVFKQRSYKTHSWLIILAFGEYLTVLYLIFLKLYTVQFKMCLLGSDFHTGCHCWWSTWGASSRTCYLGYVWRSQKLLESREGSANWFYFGGFPSAARGALWMGTAHLLHCEKILPRD